MFSNVTDCRTKEVSLLEKQCWMCTVFPENIDQLEH